MTSDMDQPWLKLPGEQEKSYSLFVLYRDLGPARSLAQLRTILSSDPKNTESSPKVLRRFVSLRDLEWLSTQHQWVSRADAYDQHMRSLEQQARETAMQAEAEKWAKRRAEQREAEWAIAHSLLALAARILQVIDPKAASAGELARVVETSAKLARLAAEMETDRQRYMVDPASLSDDELDTRIAELRKRLRAA